MELKHPQYSRITINPEVCGGTPCIRGMRFPVSTLLGYLAGGMTIDEIMEDFPFIEQADFQDAFGYAASALHEQFIPLKETVRA